MAKNLGQFLSELAKKAGIKQDDQHLIALLANADLTKQTVPQELEQQFDENLLNIEAALDQHPKIRSKYTAEVLNPFDTRMEALLDEMGLADDDKAAIKGIKSSYKRFETIAEKLKAAQAKQGGKTSDKDKEALQATIDTLQVELKQAKEGITQAKTEYEEKLGKDKVDFRLRSKIGGKKTTLDMLDEDVRYNTILGLINKKLQGQEAELRFDEKGDLQPYKKDGSKLYGANHTLIDLDSLIDAELAQNKLIQVTDPKATQQSSAAGGQQQVQHQSSPVVTLPTGGQPKVDGTNQSIAEMNKSALASLEALGTN